MKWLNLNSKGFTLIELLLVIGLLGLLIAGAVVAIPNQGRKARDSRRRVDIEQIRGALEMYRTDQVNGNYPAALAALSPNYLSTIPLDPRTPPVAYTYAGLPAGCTTAGPTFCSSYQISTTLEVTGALYRLGPQDVAP